MARWNVALGIMVMLGLFLIGVGLASAHSWYPFECCSDADCKPLPDDAIIEEQYGYRVKSSGEMIGFGDPKIRFSPDGQWHRCSYGGLPEANTICLFVPGRGS